MSLTIDLTPEMETHLRDEAAKEGLAPDRFVVGTLKERFYRNNDNRRGTTLDAAMDALNVSHHVLKDTAIERGRREPTASRG